MKCQIKNKNDYNKRAEMERRLQAYWAKKGMVEGVIEKKATLPFRLPFDEEELKKRNLRYEGIQEGGERFPSFYLFTILNKKRPDYGTTIAIAVTTPDPLGAIDRKLKR